MPDNPKNYWRPCATCGVNLVLWPLPQCETCEDAESGLTDAEMAKERPL